MALPQRPVHGLNDPNQMRRDRETLNDILTFRHDDSRIRTAAEVAAGVTPVNYAYAPGDWLRYGASPGANASTNTTAINNALASASSVFCSLPGTYVVNDNLNCQDNQTLDLSNGVVIQSDDGVSWVDTGIIEINGVTNFRMYGGTIDGNKAGNSGGRAFGVRIFDSTNVQLYGVRSINCPQSSPGPGNGGDGFVVHGSSANVGLYGCIADANERQGLSIVQVSGMIVSGGDYSNTTGSAPGAGIDIEADGVNTVLDVALIGVRCASNQIGIVVTTGASKIAIIGCNTRGNRANEMFLGDCELVSTSGCTFLADSSVDGSPVVNIIDADDVTFCGNIVIGSGNSTEREGVRVSQSCNRILIQNSIVRSTYDAGIRVGTAAMGADNDNVLVSDNMLIDCLNPAKTGIGVIDIEANSGSFYSRRVSVRGNHIYDSRTAGNEADFGVRVSTSITEAIKSGYRVEGNKSEGPATATTNLPLRGSISWNPASLGDGTGETSSAITVTGAAFGDSVDVGIPYDVQGMNVTGYVSAADTVKIRIQNETGGTIDLGAGTWTVHVRKLSE
jgi:hypothetical protein